MQASIQRHRPPGALAVAAVTGAVFLAGALHAPAGSVTLISRSNGLGIPLKEEGHTEYELGDVNGDGHLDIVSVGDHGSPYVNSDEHGIMTWLGDGDGGWTVHQFGNFGYGGCALGDLNLDGHLDVAWGVHHDWGSGMGARLLSAAAGDGTGQSWTDWGVGLGSNGETWGMFATDLADFDEDGLLDIVSQSFGGSNGLRVYANHGDGTWSQAWMLSGGSVGYTLETGDFNGDGHLDIASTRAGSYVLMGDGAFGFTIRIAGLPAGGLRGIAAGDIDGDGAEDIACAVGSAGLGAFRYDRGNEQWISLSSGLPSSGAYDLVQLGDFNGDGFTDLVAYRDPSGRIYLGDGAGNWTEDAGWQMPSPGDASALRVRGDADHDGRDDIVVQADQSGFPFYRNQLRLYSPYEEPPELTADLETPDGGEVWPIGSIRFMRWRAAVPPEAGGARADLELSVTGPGGPWIGVAADLPNSGVHQWRVTAPAPSTTCRLRLTVHTDAGSAIAVSEEDFTISGGSSTVPAPERMAMTGLLRPAPNPARTAFRLDLGETLPGPVRIALYDPRGRLMGHAHRAAGGDHLKLSLGELSRGRLRSGVYLLHITSPQGKRSGTIIVL
ncbi:MAG: T9SS type A sorting domain-containing protein [Candidatus Eisenbacteria bacterium]|nr:T9SS type A sorting domain-containing protein [Candidatus Eisenbacteria bacterium]